MVLTNSITVAVLSLTNRSIVIDALFQNILQFLILRHLHHYPGTNRHTNGPDSASISQFTCPLLPFPSFSSCDFLLFYQYIHRGYRARRMLRARIDEAIARGAFIPGYDPSNPNLPLFPPSTWASNLRDAPAPKRPIMYETWIETREKIEAVWDVKVRVFFSFSFNRSTDPSSRSPLISTHSNRTTPRRLNQTLHPTPTHLGVESWILYGITGLCSLPRGQTRISSPDDQHGTTTRVEGTVDGRNGGEDDEVEQRNHSDGKRSNKEKNHNDSHHGRERTTPPS